MTTLKYCLMQMLLSWIAFDLLLTLVFDDGNITIDSTGAVVNCFRFIAYLGLWRLCACLSLRTLRRELLSIYCLPWSLTTDTTIGSGSFESWIAFDLLLTLVFDDWGQMGALPNWVVNCFRFIAYLGLWRQNAKNGEDVACRELLSIYCLPWSLTTESTNPKGFALSWIAFDLLLTLVFDDIAK